MIRENLKYIDPLTLTATIALAGAYYSIKGNLKLGFGLLIIFVILILLIKKFSHGLLIENEYNGNAYIKPEAGCNELEPLKQTPVKVDGILTDAQPHKVFKVASGTNVFINKNGIVKTYSPISSLANKYLKTKPDDCWNKIFEKV